MKYKPSYYFTLLFAVLAFYLNYDVLFSQKYGEAWIVGYDNDSAHVPKYGKSELNFSSGNIDIKYKYGEELPHLGFTNASLANHDGTLRCFTDGFHIFDEAQKIISGGDSINYNRIWEIYRVGVYPAAYNHIFLPQPGNEKNNAVLFHFTKSFHPDVSTRIYVPTFRMSKIVWDTSEFKQSVIFKDSIITNGEFIDRHMSCAKHANGRDWWIIIEDYKTDNHRIYLFDPEGIKL